LEGSPANKTCTAVLCRKIFDDWEHQKHQRFKQHLCLKSRASDFAKPSYWIQRQGCRPTEPEDAYRCDNVTSSQYRNSQDSLGKVTPVGSSFVRLIARQPSRERRAVTKVFWYGATSLTITPAAEWHAELRSFPPREKRLRRCRLLLGVFIDSGPSASSAALGLPRPPDANVMRQCPTRGDEARPLIEVPTNRLSSPRRPLKPIQRNSC
jgi:hypothetical protein